MELNNYCCLLKGTCGKCDDSDHIGEKRGEGHLDFKRAMAAFSITGQITQI